VTYTSVFILVPILSVIWYLVQGSGAHFEGFSLAKGYMLITLAPLLVLCRISVLRELSYVLTLLALVVIAAFIALTLYPELNAPLYLFGEETGIVQLDSGRDYGADVILMQVYFVTSPMLAISIAYYCDRAMRTSNRARRTRLFALMAISVLGMMLAGSRNNILISALLPIALWFLYTRHRVRGALLCASAVIALAVVFRGELGAFFDPSELSNSVKLTLLNDYAKLFDDPIILLFGQGLGVYHAWEGRGNLYVTELTYHEMLRNFGIFGAAIMAALLLFPFVYAFVLNRRFTEKAVVIGYGAYLIMCISNPLLFSSMGILILSAILAAIYGPAPRPGDRPHGDSR